MRVLAAAAKVLDEQVRVGFGLWARLNVKVGDGYTCLYRCWTKFSPGDMLVSCFVVCLIALKTLSQPQSLPKGKYPDAQTLMSMRFLVTTNRPTWACWWLDSYANTHPCSNKQANLGMLVEAAHSSSNQGEYADIAHELGREFLKVCVLHMFL